MHRALAAVAALLAVLVVSACSAAPPEDTVDEFTDADRVQWALPLDPYISGPVDLVVTDTWLSMHDPQSARERRYQLLRPYQVNAGLMAAAKPTALFMHCLPAHRAEEVTSEVMDGPHSVVFDEAENRLHVQKAIMRWCLGV